MTSLHFDGPSYTPSLDQGRLTQQLQRIQAVMQDGSWRTLPEIARLTKAPEASVSAQLRHLRKARFGSYRVEKRRRGEETAGCWEYRVLDPLPRGQAGLF